jgi:TPR repeat protein
MTFARDARMGRLRAARRLSLRLAASLGAVGVVAGCNTAPDRYQGISLSADNADEGLRTLARRAAAGDKRAQLALGMRFETGDGVPVDLDRAERLYRLAAATSGDVEDVYFPSVRMKTPGQVLPRYEPPRFGLPEAQARLEALRQRRRAGGAIAPRETRRR